MPGDSLAGVERRKRVILIILTALVALVVFIFIAYFYQKEVTTAREQDALTATGTIEARDAMASFKVAGKIDSLLAEEGSQVKKGQKVAVLENERLAARVDQAEGAYEAARSQERQAARSVELTRQKVEAAVEQAQARVARAGAGLKDARQKYQRVKALHEEGAVPDSKLDEAQNNYDSARYKLEEARAALEEARSARKEVQVAEAKYDAARGGSLQAQGALQEAKSLLQDARLEAPVSGYVTEKFLEEGEMVNSGTPVYEITDLSQPYIKVFISEDKIGRVHLHQEAEVKVDAFPGKVFKGEVTWINSAGEFAVKKAVNEIHEHDTRSFEVKIEVPNPDLLLKTGMTAEIKLLEGAE